MRVIKRTVQLMFKGTSSVQYREPKLDRRSILRVVRKSRASKIYPRTVGNTISTLWSEFRSNLNLYHVLRMPTKKNPSYLRPLGVYCVFALELAIPNLHKNFLKKGTGCHQQNAQNSAAEDSGRCVTCVQDFVWTERLATSEAYTRIFALPRMNISMS